MNAINLVECEVATQLSGCTSKFVFGFLFAKLTKDIESNMAKLKI